MAEFHHHLVMSYDSLDVMTFGASDDAPRIKINRAVVGVTLGRTETRFPRHPGRIKLFQNVHSKLIIGYAEGQVPDVYIGSHNFVGPTLYELMLYVTDEKQSKALIDYFESFWR
jgi:hypothetical protein